MALRGTFHRRMRSENQITEIPYFVKTLYFDWADFKIINIPVGLVIKLKYQGDKK